MAPGPDSAAARQQEPTAARSRRRAAAVPAFALYGEPGSATSPGAEMLHVESIASRSQRYRWEIDAHVHRGLVQLLWLQRGSVRASLDGVEQRCEGPALIVVPAGVVHAFRFAPGTEGGVLTLGARALVEGDARASGALLQALFAAPRALALGDEAGARRLGALFALLADEFAAAATTAAAPTPVPLWLARALLWRAQEALQQHGREAGPARREHQALFTRFVVLVEAHHAEHWPIARYASQLGLTPERLNRLVRAEAGKSALELVHERLAREACRRLVYVAAPISRLAFELGFEDPAYFCRFFRRRLGCSPREFRRRGTSAVAAGAAG